jgi:RNA polymerase sigma factor (TIGR02999 family)
MNSAPSAEITGLLKAWTGGDQLALERLTPLVYDELRKLARKYMAKERTGDSMQATALVNEAFVKLIEVENVRWQDRVHFFAVSAQMMRRILVDRARARGAEKRGGAVVKVNLDESIDTMPDRGEDLVALDDALGALAELDARKAKVVELKFFGGLSVEETAEVLRISAPSVLRDWKLARAWLMREMKK